MSTVAASTFPRYPTRFRDPSENKDFFLALTERLFIRRKVTQQEVERYGTFLWKGDADADALAAKFHELGMQRAMPMLQRALAGEIPPEAPQELGALMQSVSKDPAWLDRRLLDIGARLSQRSGMLGEYVHNASFISYAPGIVIHANDRLALNIFYKSGFFVRNILAAPSISAGVSYVF